MNQQIMNNYYERFKGILKQVQDEVKKLTSKQEELNGIEQDILTIKDNTTKILQLLQRQEEETPKNIKRKIQSLNKIKEIKHKNEVWSIIELSNLRIPTGDADGYLTLCAADYDKEEWTKLKEEKQHDKGITSLCEIGGNRLVSSSGDCTLKV